MKIEIDDTICRGLLKYSEKHNIGVKKVIEESILQNQIRHNIDMEGNIYNQKFNGPVNIYELSDLAGGMRFGGTVKETTKEYFGIIFDNVEIRNYKYIIGKYKKTHTVIFITENEKEVMEQISKNKMIEVERVEDNQSYCWVTTYETMVLVTRFNNTDDIIILT
jgi:hypothetical protein